MAVRRAADSNEHALSYAAATFFLFQLLKGDRK